MAKYTMELRRVCEIYGRDEVENWFKSYNLEDYLTQKQISVINENNLWNKEKLAKKIVNHYFMREIGFETPFLFRHYAQVTMDEVMESKLPLIFSNNIDYDILVNVDFTETFERNIEGNIKSDGTSNSTANSSSNSSSSSNNLSINNNTPQTRISKQNLEDGLYASSVNQSDSNSNIEDNTNTSNESNSNSNQDSSTTETYTRSQKGNSGSLTTAQKLIEQFRNNILNVDKDIIEELNILFMGLY